MILKYDIKNVGEYSDLYLKTDILLLENVYMDIYRYFERVFGILWVGSSLLFYTPWVYLGFNA